MFYVQVPDPDNIGWRTIGKFSGPQGAYEHAREHRVSRVLMRREGRFVTVYQARVDFRPAGLMQENSISF